MSRPLWRWLALAVVLIGLVGGGAFAVRESLKTCGALDIWLKRSGCRGAVMLEGFAPMLFETMAISSKSNRFVLFGAARTPDGWRTGWAEVDLARPKETRRGPLPMMIGAINTMRVSTDGARVVINCDHRGPCVEGGGWALDVDVDRIEDAKAIEGPEAIRYRPEPPGVPDLSWKAAYRSLVLPDGKGVASLQNGAKDVDELVIRRVSDGGEIKRIALDPPAKIAPFDRSMVASRSGRLVALVTASNLPRPKVGTMVRVFDVAAGRQIGSIETDESFEAKSTGAFTPDEKGVVLVRRLLKSTATEIAIFDLPDGKDPT